MVNFGNFVTVLTSTTNFKFMEICIILSYVTKYCNVLSFGDFVWVIRTTIYGKLMAILKMVSTAGSNVS